MFDRNTDTVVQCLLSANGWTASICIHVNVLVWTIYLDRIRNYQPPRLFVSMPLSDTLRNTQTDTHINYICHLLHNQCNDCSIGQYLTLHHFTVLAKGFWLHTCASTHVYQYTHHIISLAHDGFATDTFVKHPIIRIHLKRSNKGRKTVPPVVTIKILILQPAHVCYLEKWPADIFIDHILQAGFQRGNPGFSIFNFLKGRHIHTHTHAMKERKQQKEETVKTRCESLAVMTGILFQSMPLFYKFKVTWMF